MKRRAGKRPEAAPARSGEITSERSDAYRALVVLSFALFAVRMYAATKVGFGDSEALYASYAAHPQPAYLDHPGLVGVVMRAIGENAPPPPMRTHFVTAAIATLVPWLGFVLARAAGSARRPALVAALVLAVVPEMAIGLFAMTPDLLLAPLWLGSLALAAVALRETAPTNRAAVAFVGAGLLAGTACAAKASGALLFAALVVTYASLALTKRAELRGTAVRSVWPWAGLAAGLVVVLPIARFEAKLGWPMLRHRLVETQGAAGLALRNVGAVVGGQLLYLSPVVAVLAVLAARALVRDRSRDAVTRLLYVALAVPVVPLLALSVWSRVAEPHWLAPAFLVLPVYVAVARSRSADASTALPRALASRRAFLAAASVAALFTVLAHAWVLVPATARMRPETADPRLDIASELFGWPTAIEAVRDQMKGAATPFDPEGREVVVVGPHWTICAQVHAAMPGVRVGCATPVPDDFDRWLPRETWRRADHVLFVTDNRFPGDGSEQLPAHVRTQQTRVRVMRGGRSARVFELYLYDRRASGRREPRDAAPNALPYSAAREAAETAGAMGASPASRMSERSSSSSGFGVVSSFSP